MDVLYMFLIYLIVLVILFLCFRLRAWLKIGFNVVFLKKNIQIIANENRRLEFHTLLPDGKSIEIDQSTYFTEPSKTWYFALMEKIKLKKAPAYIKKEDKTSYNVNDRSATFFGNAPVTLYVKNYPEPLDIYDLTKDKRAKSVFSGKNISEVIQTAQLSKGIHLLVWLDKWKIPIMIGGLLAIGGIVYFVVYGLTPQIAGGAAGNPLGAVL